MNVNQKIEQALCDITKEIYPLSYPYDENKPDTYIVYNPELEEPGYYADDEEWNWVQYMQVHLFHKGNYISIGRDIRIRLRKAGIMVTGIETMYEKDTQYYHLVFSCYVEEEE